MKKALNLVTLILIIVGGLNWGLVGIANLNLVDMLLGTGIARLIYILVGLSALWQLVPFFQAVSGDVDEPRAESGHV